MNNPYPWLDKPIETWTWEECKAEYLRLGCDTYDDLSHTIVDMEDQAEKDRRYKIMMRVLDDEVWNARWLEIQQVLRQAHIY